MKNIFNDNTSGIRNESGQLNDSAGANQSSFDRFTAKVNRYLNILKQEIFQKNVFQSALSTNYSNILKALIVIPIISTSCKKIFDDFPPVSNNNPSIYAQTNLVSDTAGFNAMRIDTTLANAWGIAINPNGIFWISANGKGLGEVFDKNGVPKRAPVGISSQGMVNGGTPSGVIFNSTTDFKIPATGEVSKFIFAGEDGVLSAWASGDTTRTVVNRGPWGSAYKGIEIAQDGSENFLYATDFHNGKIDVFDKNFNLVTTKPFMDPKIPSGFAPFNIRLIDSFLYVTYAKQEPPENHDDDKGPGNGFINIFKTDGSLVKRFASHGKLNSPWGIEKAPVGFGQGKNVILVGNFGDGHISVYEEFEGEFLRQLKSFGMPVTIDGLWAITFPDGKIPGDNPNKLYFTAGPNDESHGVFGYLVKH